jgi:hypothetical protein
MDLEHSVLEFGSYLLAGSALGKREAPHERAVGTLDAMILFALFPSTILPNASRFLAKKRQLPIMHRDFAFGRTCLRTTTGFFCKEALQRVCARRTTRPARKKQVIGRDPSSAMARHEGRPDRNASQPQVVAKK